MASPNWAGATAVNPVLKDWKDLPPSLAKSLVKSSPQPHSQIVGGFNQLYWQR